MKPLVFLRKSAFDHRRQGEGRQRATRPVCANEAAVTARDVGYYDEIAANIMSDNSQIKRMHKNVVLKDVKLGMFVPIEAQVNEF